MFPLIDVWCVWGSWASRVTLQILWIQHWTLISELQLRWIHNPCSVDVHRLKKKQKKHFADGRLPTYLSDFHRVLGGAAGVVLHLAPLDNFIKPAEGRKKRAGGETKKQKKWRSTRFENESLTHKTHRRTTGWIPVCCRIRDAEKQMLLSLYVSTVL